MSENGRKIQHVGVLDWTAIKTVEELGDIASIQHVGMLLIPEHLAGALAGIPMEHVGSVTTVPSGENVRLMAGQTTVTGEALAAGEADAIWVIAGQLIITTVVTQVGYKELHVAGQILAPRGSETAIGSKLKRLEGQVAYYPLGARFFNGTEHFTKEFLELLPNPIPMLINGTAFFSGDITVELLKAKVTEIILNGTILAPKALLPLLGVLTIEKSGTISEHTGSEGE